MVRKVICQGNVWHVMMYCVTVKKCSFKLGWGLGNDISVFAVLCVFNYS